MYFGFGWVKHVFFVCVIPSYEVISRYLHDFRSKYGEFLRCLYKGSPSLNPNINKFETRRGVLQKKKARKYRKSASNRCHFESCCLWPYLRRPGNSKGPLHAFLGAKCTPYLKTHLKAYSKVKKEPIHGKRVTLISGNNINNDNDAQNDGR